MMPKISGFDMLDILRSTTETKDVKVIMMTALSSEDQRKRGEQLGADRYLVKSQVGIEDVVRAVHEVLRDVPGIGTEPKPSAAAEPDNSSQDMSYVENLEVDPNDTPSVERPDVESLSPQHTRYSRVMQSCKESITRLGIDKIDLYLIQVADRKSVV